MSVAWEGSVAEYIAKRLDRANWKGLFWMTMGVGWAVYLKLLNTFTRFLLFILRSKK